jgi:hypothetical protein
LICRRTATGLALDPGQFTELDVRLFARAVYLNGTDLPDEVYASGDVNDLIAALLEGLGAEGDMQSYWEGPRETGLYLYGASAARMNQMIAPVLARFPLAQHCRVVPLGLTLPSRS